MMSDRVEAILSLIAFIAMAAVTAAAVWLLVFLWSVLQSVALLGGTAAALVLGFA